MPEDYFRRHFSNNIFGNGNPLEIDLACSNGSFLIKIAAHFQDRNFLGVQRIPSKECSVSGHIQKMGLTNIKALRLKSQYTLDYLLERTRSYACIFSAPIYGPRPYTTNAICGRSFYSS